MSTGLSTPLYLVTGQDSGKMLTFLIANGANVRITGGEPRWTPLQVVSYHGHELAVRILLKFGADMIIKAADGKTAIDIAR